MNEFNFEIKTTMQKRFTSLIVDALKNIKKIISLSKHNEKIKFEEGDDGFLSLLYAISGSWMENWIDKFENAYENEESIIINKKDLLIIKYLTEMYWNYTGSFDIAYNGIDIDVMFEDLERKSINLKNTLKVVK